MLAAHDEAKEECDPIKLEQVLHTRAVHPLLGGGHHMQCGPSMYVRIHTYAQALLPDGTH